MLWTSRRKQVGQCHLGGGGGEGRAGSKTSGMSEEGEAGA